MVSDRTHTHTHSFRFPVKLFIGLHTRRPDMPLLLSCEGDVMTAWVRACHIHSPASTSDSPLLRLAHSANTSSHIFADAVMCACFSLCAVMATASACRTFVVYADCRVSWSFRSSASLCVLLVHVRQQVYMRVSALSVLIVFWLASVYGNCCV